MADNHLQQIKINALLAEVERVREREAEFEKQRADYHHVVSEFARCERDHDALLHENDTLRSKLAGADQRAGRYSEELVMALDAGKQIAHERDGLLAENAAMRPIVEAVANAVVMTRGDMPDVIKRAIMFTPERSIKKLQDEARAFVAAHPAKSEAHDGSTPNGD